MIKKRKIAVLILTVLFVLSVALSFDFTVENRGHECRENACPVCAMISVAEEIFGGAKNAPVVFAAFVFLVAAIYFVLKQRNGFFTAVTPISLFDILTA